MAEPEEVVIKLNNGEEYLYAVTTGKGEPENPMSDAEVIAKFRDCASLVFCPERQERVLELLLNLESLERVSDLTKILSL